MKNESIKQIEANRRGIVRLAASVFLVTVFVLLIWDSARSGFAALLYSYAVRANQTTAAAAAVKIAPNDPEAHLLQGSVLEAGSDLPGAITAYERAAQLRPDDYVLWLALARACELNGETNRALVAARRAVPLAPFYAQPHWQLGNLLVRAGQREEGFKELRLAGASNPALLPGIIDLAWQLSKGDVQFVKQSIQPQSPESYKALAEYFKKRGEVSEAVAMFGAAGNDVEVVRARAQYLNELVAAKKFNEAYRLWLIGRGLSSSNGVGALVDPGFENESDLAEPGFQWRATGKVEGSHLALDASNPREGRSSLQVSFNGDSDPSRPVISQLVLVEPRAHYQLHFATRTEEIVSGGLPEVAVLDAGNQQPLGQSGALPQASGGWRDYNIDFTTADTTTAIQIALLRERCSKSPCPIFGRLWLDGFSLQKR